MVYMIFSCKHHTDKSTYQAYTSQFQFNANTDMKQMSECLTGTETHERLIIFTLSLKVHDDGTVIQLPTFWDINLHSAFYVKQHFEGQTLLPSSGNTFTRLGPTDTASP